LNEDRKKMIIHQKQKQWNTAVKESVCFALRLTLIQLCGCTDNTDSDELQKIAKESILFPNNGVIAFPGTTADISSSMGKPYDIELRIALKVFHRFKQRKESNISCPNFLDTAESKITQPSYIAEIKSDLGVLREFKSAQCLADHTVKALEEIIGIVPCVDFSSVSNISGESKKNIGGQCNNMLRDVIYDMRTDQSGIIYLVTTARVQQLRALGRLPCSLCIKFCKGEKGLWWHQQQEHGRYHSDAINDAKAQTNHLSIIPYCDSSTCFSNTREDLYPNISSENNNNMTSFQVVHIDFNNAGFIDATKQVPDFMELIKTGNLEQLKYMIMNGSLDPRTYTDRNGSSLIHWAAGCGHLPLIHYLIETCGCSPHLGQRGKRAFCCRTPMHWAARNGHLEVVQYLVRSCHVDLEAATADGTTSFCWACWQGHLHVMRFLYAEGCNIHSSNCFGCNAVLWCAQGDGDLAVIEYLESISCDLGSINSNGHGVLHKAAQRGNWKLCQYFFSKLLHNELAGLKSDEREMAISMIQFVAPDIGGCCPSDLAGMEGHEKLAKWLVNEESLATKFVVPSTLPDWICTLIENEFLSDVKFCVEWAKTFWGRGGGARRMALSFLNNERNLAE